MKTLQSASSPRMKHDPSKLWFEFLTPPERTRLVVFCFPYAGGSAQIYRNWRLYLPSQISVCLVHLPGRGKRIKEPPVKKLTSLVTAVADVFAHQLDRPFALFGHSMGALICFELAREIERRHDLVASRLYVSARRAPQVPGSDPPNYALPDDEFVAEVKKLNGTPAGLFDDPETRELFMPVIRADFEVVDTYRYQPGPLLRCPISVYGGLQDTGIPVSDLRAWEKQTLSTCTVRMLAGDHFFINDPSQDFFRILRRDLLLDAQNCAKVDERRLSS